MGKVRPTLDKWRSRSWQILPYTLLGAILFAWVSSAQIDGYLSVYLVLIAAQLGTVAIYLVMRSLKVKADRNRL